MLGGRIVAINRSGRKPTNGLVEAISHDLRSVRNLNFGWKLKNKVGTFRNSSLWSHRELVSGRIEACSGIKSSSSESRDVAMNEEVGGKGVGSTVH